MTAKRWIAAAALSVALIATPLVTAQLDARIVIRNQPVGPGGTVNLPYMVADSTGNQWRLYQGGNLQQQGNTTIYSQGAQLIINGNQPSMNVNQARIDEKSGEVIFDVPQNLPVGIALTRRVFINKEEGFVRYVDVFKNTAGQDQTLNLQIQTNSNYSMNVARTINDPKRKDQHMAWIGTTPVNNGASLVEVFSGPGSKQAMTINWPQGNSYVQATMALAVPANKEVALMHLHYYAPNADAGMNFINSIRPGNILKTVPAEIRKLIVNWPGGTGFIGDLEVLRGDMLDVVELKGGDQIKGTLKESKFELETFYGDVELAVDRVVGVINVGQYRPRQLIVTSDGQIFGGRLKKQTIDLQLSSGQVTPVPLAQVSRLGYRRRAGEPEEWTFDRPMVLMRTGERVIVQMPSTALEVITRYGKLSLKPETVAAVLLQNEENGVHQVFLADGSKFAGLLVGESFEMKLDDSAGGKTIKFPAGSVARLQLTGKVQDADDSAATLQLSNDDMLVGTLTGGLKVDTAFDTIAVNASEIKNLSHPKDNPLDVQLTLWDGTTLSGQLQEQEVMCQLSGGVAIKVPVALVASYEQPSPQPSDQMLAQIEKTVKELNADDWKQRDRAEAQLVSMGPVASGILKKLRDSQPPEAQQRIDLILKELDKQRKGAKPGGANPAAPPAGGLVPGPTFRD